MTRGCSGTYGSPESGSEGGDGSHDGKKKDGVGGERREGGGTTSLFRFSTQREEASENGERARLREKIFAAESS